ncbi:S8 family serine peptidase [Nocardioides sp. zg-1228]|uniref:S8 family serine peptidase n=1 Tax=Nocardioides sp. zg-1228 TaxID=2763008 RepID=UPI0016428581|nr:S8 family serine peptidase [Nocardioides sp. zg-1228]MBC2934008.1 S8 family serine peptidase [Nocardioides sp. zg-1228]QSF58764.1 S8 family serine peptidase [Nocardioides sp. zg-1228]
MARRFDVHLLPAPPDLRDGDPYDTADGGIVFRGLPLLAWPAGVPPDPRFEVLRTWPRYPRTRLRLLHALDAAKAHDAHVYRLSLGVTRSRDPESDPLAHATRFLRERNRLVVAAAGDWGPRPGTLDDLARAPGVIAVAGCTPDGLLLDCSSRGTVDGARPTLTADGTDPTGPARPGTDLAAARVAVLCVWIRSMLQCLAAEASAARAGERLTEMPAPSRLAHVDSDFSRDDVDALVALRQGRGISPAGSVIYAGATMRRIWWLGRVMDHAAAQQVPVAFDAGADWVARVLLATARPGPAPDPVGGGAGVVSRESVRALLADMTPSRFLRLFADDGRWDERRAAVAAALDHELGELWSLADLETCEQLYAAEHEDLFVEVGPPGATGHGHSRLRVGGPPTTYAQRAVHAHLDERGDPIHDPDARPTSASPGGG